MGMFDYIRCEVPLPDGWSAHDLQTKDFDCQMVMHIITKDGRLMFERIDNMVEVPKSERPFPDAPDGSLQSFCGSIRTITTQYDANFHGVVNFYGSEYQRMDGSPSSPGPVMHQGDTVCDFETKEPLKHIWHEYNAKFTDGQLVEIDLVPDRND